MRKLKLGLVSGLLMAAMLLGSTVAATPNSLDGAAVRQRGDGAMKEISAVRALIAESEGMPKSGPVREATKDKKASTPSANPYRAYAPSCLSYPLPIQFSGPLYPPDRSFRVLLAARDEDVPGVFFEETVNVRVWRIPCSSSGEFDDSVTLLAIDRDPANEGNSNRYPLFPGLRLTQGSQQGKFVRVADEPNTVVSHSYADEPLIDSGTYVLENFASTSLSTAVWDFNNQFTLTFLNFFVGDNGQNITIPTYNPTQQTYPDAFANIPITGYLTGNWFDEAHSGEGMLVQVFDLPNTSNLLFTFAWFTFGPDGRPFWLFGATTIAPDTRGPIDVPTIFHTNGGFAGQFGSSTTTNTWGSVRFSFPACYEMRFRYSSTTTATGVPQGTGERTWVRTVETNGLTCE